MKRLHSELSAADYLALAQRLLAVIDPRSLERLADLLHEAYENDKGIFIFGNGGSGATASHLAEDLCHGTVAPDRRMDESFRRYRALSLVDNVPWVLALANDLGYERIFVEQLRSLAQPGDVALAISGSGNSPNVLQAVEWANRHGLTSVGITGFDGGELGHLQQVGVNVPVNNMALTESVHSVLLHWVVDDLYERMNDAVRQPAAAVKIG
jgi:D-sedoheptulose 7-phosphate isomerase